MTVQDRKNLFYQVVDKLYEIYEDKNSDYGDSFVYGLNKMGRHTFATRMMDKQQRLESLVLKELRGETHKVKDESFNDTVRDQANYAIMYLMWVLEQNQDL